MSTVPLHDPAAVLAAAIVVLPAAAGALLAIGGRRLERHAAWIATLASLAALAAAIALEASPRLPLYPAAAWVPGLGLSVTLRADFATLALAALISGMGALVLAYAGNYFGPTEKGRVAIATLSLFQAAMLGLVLADDVLLLFVFWELTGLCSFFLIKTEAGKRTSAYLAARRALLVTGAGAVPMLLGLLILARAAGTSRLSEMASAELGGGVVATSLALILFGVLSKSAQMPLHFWLPGAMDAPTPISAYLHSATMVKAGLILLAYLYPILGGTEVWVDVLVPLGAITCIWGAYHALTQDDIKLLMAWSTVSQLGLITVTLGLGTELALRAALLHLFAHAVFKAGLFLVVGAVDHAAGTRSLAALGGLGRRAPLLFATAAILGASMVGLPPFVGFLSKELILAKAMLAHPLIHACAITGIALGSIGTVAYTARFVLGTFTGDPKSDSARVATAPGAAWMVGPVVLAGLGLAGGLLAPVTDRALLEPMTAALLGYELPAKDLELWHGINAPLLWTLGILTAGTWLYRSRRLGERSLPRRLADEGADRHDRLLVAFQHFGARVATAIAGASPSLYFVLALALALSAALPLVPSLAALELGGGGAALAVTAIQLVLLGILVVTEGRLSAVVVLGLVGATVAVLFRLLSAPDLMLTQLLVEVLTTVFLVLALRLFRRDRRSQAVGWRRPSAARAVLAATGGLAAAGLAASLLLTPANTGLADAYRAAGPELAKGRNLVNVILVDFRGLDTAIETIVVVVAALGVVGLLRGREVGGAGERVAVDPALPDNRIVAGVGRLVLPLSALFAGALLLKGHDEPGGGFVAGLVLAIGALLASQTHGARRLEAALPWRPDRIALAGVAILLGCLLAPLAFGHSMLTHASGELPILGKWHGALLFDVGVTLAVAGAATTAAMALAARPRVAGKRA